MNNHQTFLDALVNSIKTAGKYLPDREIAPIAILWPDSGREWEPLMPRLREHLHILTLGSFMIQNRIGPPAWIRCMLARVLPDRLAPNVIPVIYLPGVSAIELCNVEHRPKRLDDLVDIYFRSAIWTNNDCRDWSVSDFFQSTEFGPGIELRDDDFTIKAMRRVLPVLCDLTIGQLKANEPWKPRDFDELVADITKMIAMGESAELEFKSTARWNVKENKKDPTIEKVIVKTIAGFLNFERGGALLIGVEDNGEICGIETDFQAFSSEKDRNPDAYERWLVGLLLNTYGHKFAPQIHISFHPVLEKTVCKVVIDPAPDPAFVSIRNQNGQEEDIFYLRTGNSTNSLRMRDFLAYYQIHWVRQR